jgi:hypothetical protein
MMSTDNRIGQLRWFGFSIEGLFLISYSLPTTFVEFGLRTEFLHWEEIVTIEKKGNDLKFHLAEPRNRNPTLKVGCQTLKVGCPTSIQSNIISTFIAYKRKPSLDEQAYSGGNLSADGEPYDAQEKPWYPSRDLPGKVIRTALPWVLIQAIIVIILPIKWKDLLETGVDVLGLLPLIAIIFLAGLAFVDLGLYQALKERRFLDGMVKRQVFLPRELVVNLVEGQLQRGGIPNIVRTPRIGLFNETSAVHYREIIISSMDQKRIVFEDRGDSVFIHIGPIPEGETTEQVFNRWDWPLEVLDRIDAEEEIRRNLLT